MTTTIIVFMCWMTWRVVLMREALVMDFMRAFFTYASLLEDVELHIVTDMFKLGWHSPLGE
jgi:hypothetical protein